MASTGAQIKTAPMQMLAPTRNTQTTDQKLVVDWIALEIPENGYSTILSYNLVLWSTANNNVQWSLIGLDSNYVGTTLTMTDGVNYGSDYNFKVRSKNIYGWGTYSAITDFAAADVPYKMAKPVTQVDPSDGENITLTWVAPYANSDAISEYKLKFLAKVGQYYTTSACSVVGTFTVRILPVG